ncbi:MAG: hypothetical protein ACK5AO_10340, partial [bacterium]
RSLERNASKRKGQVTRDRGQVTRDRGQGNVQGRGLPAGRQGRGTRDEGRGLPAEGRGRGGKPNTGNENSNTPRVKPSIQIKKGNEG